MQPLRAEIRVGGSSLVEKRTAARRSLQLDVPAHSLSRAVQAVIHNLSVSGLLLEGTAHLQVGETLEIDLPNAGPTPALVKWMRGDFAGCEFVAPVSQAAISAALLKSPIQIHKEAPIQTARDPGFGSAGAFNSGSVGERLERHLLIPALVLAALFALALVIALLAFPFST